MTVEENSSNLASSWQQYVSTFYYEVLRNSFERVLKKSENEGLSDMNCLVFKVPIDLDFSHLINYNPEFYDYFNTASPVELKGLIRESVVPVLQELVRNVDEEVKIDKRQVSVEFFMKNLPCTPDIILNGSDFYQSAIPKLCTDSLDLKASWDSHPCLMSGKIVELSESFYLSDIQTFACTNPRCRNNKRVIRHVGLDNMEEISELGPEELKPEVFIASISKTKTVIKCHNCREEISELYPFRSNLEFKMAKLKIEEPTCFSIDLLLVGSKNCLKVKLSERFNFIGFPKLTAEIPHQLKLIVPKLKSHYFEVYGVDDIAYCTKTHESFINESLNWLTNNTSEKLRFPLLVMLCQIIGSYNGINFNVCLAGIDLAVLERISKLLNVMFNNSSVLGSLKANMIKDKALKPKVLTAIKEIYPNIVNIITCNNVKLDDSKSFIFTNNFSNDKTLSIPIELSLSEEAEILLNTISKFPKFELPRAQEIITLSPDCIKKLQTHFLSMRSSTNLPLKSSLNLLTKLAQISAISQYKQEADSEDAQFSIMIHEKIIESCDDDTEDFDYRNQIMSPSVSFDFGTDSPGTKKLKNYYNIL